MNEDETVVETIKSEKDRLEKMIEIRRSILESQQALRIEKTDDGMGGGA